MDVIIDIARAVFWTNVTLWTSFVWFMVVGVQLVLVFVWSFACGLIGLPNHVCQLGFDTIDRGFNVTVF
jgi:hypothetical protein